MPNLANKYKPKKKRNRVTKYAREYIIMKMAEMILDFKDKSEIVDWVHTEHGFAVSTITNLLTEAKRLAGTCYTDEEKQLLKNMVTRLYISSIADENEPRYSKYIAAKQLSDIMGWKQSTTTVKHQGLNFDDKDEEIKTIDAEIIDAIEIKINKDK